MFSYAPECSDTLVTVGGDEATGFKLEVREQRTEIRESYFDRINRIHRIFQGSGDRGLGKDSAQGTGRRAEIHGSHRELIPCEAISAI
jgi:hypothetical protein